jgi:hypothetical protein
LKTYEGHPSDIYRLQLLHLMEAPEVTVRGRPTRELLNVITEVSPLNCVQIVPGRRLNPWLALSEGLALIAGSDLVRHLEPYNKRIKEFSDDGVTFYGSYGARITDQIQPLLDRLRRETTDRRAVLSIWRDEDLEADTKDPPCNDLIMFKLRDERLHMSVHNRSNDLHWGLHAVNLPQFAILQQYLAMMLHVGVGKQTHWSDSLHLYLDGPHVGITKGMMEAMNEPITYLDAPFLFPNHNSIDEEHATYAKLCYYVLDGTPVSNPPFLKFASDFLYFYRNRNHSLMFENKQFDAWVEAGMHFLRK